MYLIKNGKRPDEPYNAALSFPLPAKTPYGNFQLKWMKIILRLDEANRKIAESQTYWRQCKAQIGGMLPVGAYKRHVFANEEAIYMLRRAADELVALIWCLAKFEQDGKFPEAIEVDCVGAVVSQSAEKRHEAFGPHSQFMTRLNEIANAFKHSFINSDHTVLGAEEPRVYALGLANNKLKSGAVFHDVSLSELVDGFNSFYASCVEWLKSFSKRNC